MPHKGLYFSLLEDSDLVGFGSQPGQARVKQFGIASGNLVGELAQESPEIGAGDSKNDPPRLCGPAVLLVTSIAETASAQDGETRLLG